MKVQTARAALHVLLLLGAGSNARADDAVSEEAAKKAEARQRLDRGNELLRERQYEGALTEYEAAYAAFASPKIRLNIAEAHFQLGDWASAHANYTAFLNEAAGESELHGAARARKAELEQKVAFLEIESPVQGASISVDGKDVGEAPVERMVLNPGRHVITAKKSGYQSFETAEVLTSGETKSVVLALVIDAPPPVITQTETRPSDDGESVLEQWWFWAIVGGVVIVGAGVAIAASTGGSDFLPAGELGASGTSTWQTF